MNPSDYQAAMHPQYETSGTSAGRRSIETRRSVLCRLGTAALVGAGGFLLTGVRSSRADEKLQQLSAETMLAFGRVDRMMHDLHGYLKAIRFEQPALLGVNYFSVSVGGIDAVRDLEESRGVDPETFAGLYAGYAGPDVAKHLNLKKFPDERGRLTLKVEAADGRLRYKNAVVRLYSPARLRELFSRRQAFRAEQDRERLHNFTQYVYHRLRELGDLRGTGAASTTEIQELADRYAALQPLLLELDGLLRSDVGASSVMPAGIGQHFLGYAVGGIDAVSDLTNKQSVDPETYAAISANFVAPDYAEALQFLPNGTVTYDEIPLKMYSVPQLEAFFRTRDHLSLMAGSR